MNKVFDSVVRVWRFFPRPVRFSLAVLSLPLQLIFFFTVAPIGWVAYLIWSILKEVWEAVE